MCAIKNFILAAICDGDVMKFNWLHLWMKRIFCMVDFYNDRIPVFYGARRFWNTFETLLNFIGDEGYRPLTTSLKNIDPSTKLFILLECNTKNITEMKELLYQMRKEGSHGKFMIYVSDKELVCQFPKIDYKLFHMMHYGKISALSNMLIDNFNRIIVQPAAPQNYLSQYVMKASV